MYSLHFLRSIDKTYWLIYLKMLNYYWLMFYMLSKTLDFRDTLTF